MSKHIHNMKIGDKLMIKGPRMKIEFKPNMKKEIGMIAGGTGITPMLQIIKYVLNNPNDQTQLSLLFANVEERDILLREQLDSLSSRFPSRFKIFYILDKVFFFPLL